MAYSKFGWAANGITEEDMAQLYHLKQKTRKHITVMVGEAVRLYLSRYIPSQETSTPLTDKKEKIYKHDT